MEDQYNAKKVAINTPAANGTSGPVEKSRIANDAATATAKDNIEDGRSDTPVIPIAESPIARQSGHFGIRMKPIIELTEVKPARSGFRYFMQLISATPLLLCGFATRILSARRCFTA
jgi:hypothetical protein